MSFQQNETEDSSQKRVYSKQNPLLLYFGSVQEIYRCYAGGKEFLEVALLEGRRSACSPQMHHAQAPNATGARIQIIRTKQAINAAMSSGAMQYPRTQRPWKKDLYDIRRSGHTGEGNKFRENNRRTLFHREA
jgi:hypothetical protein